ncbi:MAG: peroxiredoxin [Actinomycetes bacterium]
MSVEVGQQAPDFTLPNQHGEPVTLSSFRGSKNVVVIFFPWAFTGPCTSELCEIRDRIASFDNDDTVTLAVSCDAKFSLRIFAERDGYTFSMLSDFWPHGETARAYGVFNDTAGAALRGTFIVDKSGIVRYSVVNAIPDVRDPGEYEAALAAL